MVAMTAWITRRGIQLVTVFAALTVVYLISESPAAALAGGAIALLPLFFSLKPAPSPKPLLDISEPQQPADPFVSVKAAFAGFDSPVFLLDGDGNVLYQNPSAFHAFGEIVPGQHVSARVRQPAVLEVIKDSLATGKAGTTENDTAAWYAGTADSVSTAVVVYRMDLAKSLEPLPLKRGDAR